jgi:hypothetical protein
MMEFIRQLLRLLGIAGGAHAIPALHRDLEDPLLLEEAGSGSGGLHQARQAVADKLDMFPETLFAINGGGILGKHPRGEDFSEYTD